jgi:protease-4
MENSGTGWDRIRPWFFWAAIPLAIGLLAASLIPKPIIGIIRLDDAIYTYTAQDMVAQINYAREHREIRAVVLALNSPGGTVVDTEAVYMELSRLRGRKPIVTAVNGMAASGAYYIAANTDQVYAKPTSLVGNIGVISYLPPAPFIIEDVITTGPYKLWGSPRDADMRQTEMVKLGFFQAVELGRKDRLNAGPEVIFTGEIWTGIEALRLGIVDELGTETDAAKKAAELARIANYEVRDLRELAGLGSGTRESFFLQSPDGMNLPYPKEAGTYLLYIPPLPFPTK